MPVITVSSSFASGGEPFGRALARHLNYDYMDRELVREVARRANVSEEFVRSQEDGKTVALMQTVANVIDKDFIKRIIGYHKKAGYLDPRLYLEKLTEIVLDLARKDNVVIVGRGSHCILQYCKGAYFVRVVAEREDRIKNARSLLSPEVSDVEKAIQEQDVKEKKFMEYFYHTDWMDPSLFHLSINLSKVSIDKALELVVDLIR
jgi:hypothetical protein